MSTHSDLETVLTERAAKLASRKNTIEAYEQKTPISVISAGKERFGIPTEYLYCIVKTPPVAQMPNVPKWHRGIAQIRGELVGVVDIASWFGVPGKTQGDFLAVIEAGRRKLGLLIDSVTGFRDVGATEISESFSAGTRGSHPILATTKDVTTILDIPQMVDNPDMHVGAVGLTVHGNGDGLNISTAEYRGDQ